MDRAIRAIIDSDVLIDYLGGLEKAKRELARYTKSEISIISWMEIMTGAATPRRREGLR